MGIMDIIKDQFIDVIEYIDEEGKTIVKKYERPYSGNNEIKTGAKVIVRPSQAAVFFKQGQFADILKEGQHKLTTNNLPILSTLMAFPHLFNSPIKADLYFINLRQFIGNKWETKNPLIIRDKELKIVRVKALGAFAFKIVDVEKFVREILGTQGKVETSDIVNYLDSYLVETFSTVLGEINVPIIDLARQYSKLADLIQLKANIKAKEMGIEFSEVIIESIILPEEVEKLIDEQAGIGMASQDMDEFIQYQSARAIRDAASQSGGVAGLGASIAIGKQIAETMADNIVTGGNSNDNDELYEKLREYKKLLDEGALTQDEYDSIKKKLLS
ncbi:MAG: SPFH domain-containing protein [Clostridia bacterium]|nr:SPFH domain-containing protein [Clostridia bacterium]